MQAYESFGAYEFELRWDDVVVGRLKFQRSARLSEGRRNEGSSFLQDQTLPYLPSDIGIPSQDVKTPAEKLADSTSKAML